MKFFMNKDRSNKELIVKLICLIMAILMFLCSCGKEETTSKKKKKKVIVVKKPESSDTVDLPQDENNEFVYEEEEAEEEEEEDEGPDLQKEAVVDRSNRESKVPAKYSKLMWNEEFDGNSINTDKWAIRPDESGLNKSKMSFSTPEFMNVKDGAFHMYTRRWFDPYDPNIQYADAVGLWTKDTMSWRYGYIELCAKCPMNSTAWTSFWTQSGIRDGNKIIRADDGATYDFMLEIDMIETFGSYDTIVPNLHKWYTPKYKQKATELYAQYNPTSDEIKNLHTQNEFRAKYVISESENLGNEYHTYGFEWTPTYMAWYFDGIEYDRYEYGTKDRYYFSQTKKVVELTDMWNFDKSGQHMFFIIGNGAITPDSSGDIGDGYAPTDSEYPGELAIDWVRLYQDPNQAGSEFWKVKS